MDSYAFPKHIGSIKREDLFSNKKWKLARTLQMKSFILDTIDTWDLENPGWVCMNIVIEKKVYDPSFQVVALGVVKELIGIFKEVKIASKQCSNGTCVLTTELLLDRGQDKILNDSFNLELVRHIID